MASPSSLSKLVLLDAVPVGGQGPPLFGSHSVVESQPPWAGTSLLSWVEASLLSWVRA